MKKRIIIAIFILGVFALIFGLILMRKNVKLTDNKIEIIDATYTCNSFKEEFYRDGKYIYYFPCAKSSSIYVKYSNGNKELVVDALKNGNVTIEKLDSAGLKYSKESK